MQLTYPGATLRLLGPQTEPRIGVPRIFIVHTMVGYLKSVDSMFRSGGFDGVESTFGLGGPNDPPGFDGAVWQWQLLDHQADAQGDGNAYATSVETSDGGHPERPWSARQLEALIDLGVWWCRQTGHPARLVRSTSEAGFGYHRQFSEWNPNGHSCPGDVRLAQYLDHVIPEINRRLTTTTGEAEMTPDEMKALAIEAANQVWNRFSVTTPDGREIHLVDALELTLRQLAEVKAALAAQAPQP